MGGSLSLTHSHAKSQDCLVKVPKLRVRLHTNFIFASLGFFTLMTFKFIGSHYEISSGNKSPVNQSAIHTDW
jgi:hypothetical protein